MAQPPPESATADSPTRSLATYLVLTFTLLVAVAGFFWLAVSQAIFDQHTVLAGVIVAFLLAALVGFCELISRYRDSPWVAAGSVPGLCYVSMNGAAGAIALGVIYHFDLGNSLHIGDNWLDRSLLAGFGAMIVIRSKLFTLRQPGGTDIAVGPAFAVDTFLTAVNREVDRHRARKRTQLVAMWARRLRRYSFDEAAPMMTAALGAYQDLEGEYAKRLRQEFLDLQKDEVLKGYSNEVKFFYVGFDIMTVFGQKPFEGLFTELERYLRKDPP
jgi:hypothetical protein